MNLYIETFATPASDFTIALDSDGAVVATAFGPAARLPAPARNCHTLYHNRRSAGAREQILAYFAGERRDFDLALAPQGSVFQRRVWSALRKIPFGETRSYGDLARALGSSPRAVGRANATNPICLIIPCHRVIGADGSLTGYAFGEDIKRRLLEHEGSLQPALA